MNKKLQTLFNKFKEGTINLSEYNLESKKYIKIDNTIVKKKASKRYKPSWGSY